VHRQQAVQNNQVRLGALGGEGVDRPIVLFVCVHNSGRSRMAAAFLNEMAGDRYRSLSAGTEPADHPNPKVVEAMKEIGIEIPDTPGVLLTQQMTDAAIKVIGMGCAVEEACPALRVPLEDWQLPDPKSLGENGVAEVRDKIEMKVRNLIAQLDRDQGP